MAGDTSYGGRARPRLLACSLCEHDLLMSPLIINILSRVINETWWTSRTLYKFDRVFLLYSLIDALIYYEYI